MDNFIGRAVEANRNLYTALQSFVCHEQIERYKGRGQSANGRHFDSIVAKVSLENGEEHYSELQQRNHPLSALSTLDGAWSEGEFGTLLKQTEQLLQTQSPLYEGEEAVDGTPALVYRFDVSRADSPWDLAVMGQHYFISFRTRVWLSRTSGEILKIRRSSTEIPEILRIAKITWGVTLKSTDLNGKQWLLPSEGEYQVAYRTTDRREWNTMKFSDYHRYGSEVALRFN